MRIGVFDSGIGGITVLDELRRRFPATGFVYLGDTANLPYGSKSKAQVQRLSAACALALKEHHVDVVVVACNTASSLALDEVRAAMGGIPVLGVVEPGVEAAIQAAGARGTAAGAILVLATRATIQSAAYGNLLRARLPSARIIEQACPLLVPMIEEGWIDHPILHQTIREYVAPHVAAQEPGVALLGCTHYPWIQAAFELALPGWTVVNSAQAVATALQKAVSIPGGTPGKKEAALEWIFTDPQALPAFARQLIGGQK